jgi:hypothetical protein
MRKFALLLAFLLASPALAQFSLFQRVIAVPGASVGDIYYTATTGGQIARLGLGATGYCLTAGATIPVYAACGVNFSGSLAGDVTGTQGATVVRKLNGVSLAGLATGILKNTITTGAPSIAGAASDYVAPSAYASANGLTLGTARLLGRTTAATGAAEEISIAGNLTLSGGVLTGTSGGTVTAVSVASSNGFAGSSSGGATPALTLSTSITGLLKGNGTAISAAAAADVPSVLTTKGDLFGYSTVGARVPAGSDYQVLTADSASAAGVKYRSGFALIQTITTAASQATVDFTSIPGSCTSLEVRYQARSNVAANDEGLFLKMNNDGTSGNYTTAQYDIAVGTGAAIGTVAASAAGMFIGNCTGGSSTAGYTADGFVRIENYLGTTFNKSASAYSTERAGTARNIISVGASWSNTAAVTRLTFSVPTSFVNGSVFSLYCVGGP